MKHMLKLTIIGATVMAMTACSSAETTTTTGGGTATGTEGGTTATATEGGTTEGATTEGETTEGGTTEAGTTGGGDTTSGGSTGGTTGVVDPPMDTMPPMTDDSCTGILECLGTCPQGDQLCQQQCLSNGNQAAQQGFLAVFTCVQGDPTQGVPATCPEGTTACIIEKCWDAFTGCFSNGSDLTCSGILGCLTAAGNDQNAGTACLASAQSQDIANQFSAIGQCVLGECPAGAGGQPDAACSQAALSEGGACQSVFAACQNDEPIGGADEGGTTEGDTTTEGGTTEGTDTTTEGGTTEGTDTTTEGGTTEGTDTTTEGGTTEGADTTTEGGTTEGADTTTEGGTDTTTGGGTDTTTAGGTDTGGGTDGATTGGDPGDSGAGKPGMSMNWTAFWNAYNWHQLQVNISELQFK